jgi:nucleotide-binding universal stress UspA family protein
MTLYTRLIVPLDGSMLAESALPEAKKMAALTGAELLLLRVIDYSSKDRLGDFGLLYEYEAMDKAVKEEHELASAYLADRAKRVADESYTVTTKVIDGIAAKAIVGLAQPGDLIVMATHGRTGMKRWFIGSVAEEVLRHATVPVLLVHAVDPAPFSAAVIEMEGAHHGNAI